jgi:hypothetical protein
MTLHTQQSDIGVMSFAAKPLVKTMTACVLARARGTLNPPRSVEVMKFQPLPVASTTPVARSAIQVEGILPQFAAMVRSVRGPALVVGAGLFKVIRAQMLFANRLLLAIATSSIHSPLAVVGQGSL